MERQKKNILKNQSRGIFPRHKIHHLLQMIYRKDLLAMMTLKKKIKIKEQEQQKKRNGKKTNKKQGT